ncbi:hypothetical protein ABZT48_27975 [Streptomyces avermitilis]|uniref:hypothetical protein n=1 Tax=Streptomyces avermitilis TaxID=33903 RepID=UPI0033B27F53
MAGSPRLSQSDESLTPGRAKKQPPPVGETPGPARFPGVAPQALQARRRTVQ